MGCLAATGPLFLVLPVLLGPAVEDEAVTSSASVSGLRSSASTERSGTRPVAPRDHIRLRRRFDAEIVRDALRGARRRLQGSNCRQILTDFADPDGQTLASRLGLLGDSLEDRLDQMLFYDGDEATDCQPAHVMARAIPGSPVVRMCPPFLRRYYIDRRYGQVMILHEALHSIGLSENPPSSAEITARIMARCGR
jgi:hypothetical protein